MNNEQYIVIKIDENPTKSFNVQMDDILVSKSSDLSKAKGSLLLTKSAVKDYIDRTLNNHNKIFDKFLYSASDLVLSNEETENGITISDKPIFLKYQPEGVVIDLTDKGIVADNQGRVKQVVSNPILIRNSAILEVLNIMNVDYAGCQIYDSKCDGSEDSKYLTNIGISGISYEMERRDSCYQYFITKDNEIIYGKINTSLRMLEDISRGNVVDSSDNIIPIKPLMTSDTLRLLNSIRIYFNVVTNEIRLYPNMKVYYVYNSDIASGLENEMFYSTYDKKWNIYKSSVWLTLNDFVYLGDIICNTVDGKVYVYGFNHSDLKFILDNHSNIELKVDHDIIYTLSDKTYLSVLNRFLEFNCDRLKWNLSDYKEDGEVYLYIDGYGETFVDTLRPLYVDILKYYRHYNHYWRCVGKATYINSEWIVYSEKEM